MRCDFTTQCEESDVYRIYNYTTKRNSKFHYDI